VGFVLIATVCVDSARIAVAGTIVVFNAISVTRVCRFEEDGVV
jgi:hypothetical protein